MVTLLAVLVLVSGCATLTLPPYPVREIQGYPNAQTQDSVTAAVQPVLDAEAGTRHFGFAPLQVGVVPVLVVVENRHATDSVALLREHVSLVAGDTPVALGSTTVGSEDSGKGLIGVGGGLTGLAGLFPVAGAVAAPLLIAGWKQASDVTVIRYNLTVSELMSTTLSPSESTSGFLYISLASLPANRTDVLLEIAVTNLRTKTPSRFRFPVSLKGAPR